MTTRNRCNPTPDVREFLENEIRKQSSGSGTDSGDYRFAASAPPVIAGPAGQPAVVVEPVVTAPATGDVGNEDYAIYFDSMRRDPNSNIAGGELRFSIPPFNRTQDIKNSVQIRLDDFYFPRVQGPATSPDYFFYKRIYMQIANLPSNQGVLSYDSNQFYFELDIDDVHAHSVHVRPVTSAQSVYLHRPQGTLSELQIVFMRQPFFDTIPLPADNFFVRAVPGSVPASFTILTPGVTTAVIAPIGAIAAPGIAAFFREFVSPDPTLNVAVTEKCGLFVTNITSLTQFEVGSLSFATLGAAVNAHIYVAKNRIAFTMRFTVVRNQSTNYSSLEHV